MKHFLTVTIAVLALFSIASCSNGNGEGGFEHSFAADLSLVDPVPAEGAVLKLTVHGDVDFSGKLSAVKDGSKSGLSFVSGSGNCTVDIVVPANPTAEIRNFELAVSTSEKVSRDSYTFEFSQSAPVSGDSPFVLTDDAKSITASSAWLSASFGKMPVKPRELGFEWGTDTRLEEVLQSSDIVEDTEGGFGAGLDGLEDNVTYYFRAYVITWEDGAARTYYGAVKSFVTAQSAGVAGAGWYELPAMNVIKEGNYMRNADNPDEYFAYHICAGGEKGPGGKTARNYTVCYSGRHHCPVWVAAPRHDMYEGGSGRSEAYRRDDKIPSDIQYSSKTTGGGCNKGHMLGSAERTSSVATNKQVYYYTNIAPQLTSGFNTGGGGWNLLEDYVDTQVCSDTLYVVIGCYFDKFTDGYGNTVSPKVISYCGRDDVDMPTMFYYILMRTKNGRSGKALKDCSASEIKCAAFVRAHTNDLKGQEPSSKELMSVSDLEKITGFTYFPNVPNAPKDSFSASDWGL